MFVQRTLINTFHALSGMELVGAGGIVSGRDEWIAGPTDWLLTYRPNGSSFAVVELEETMAFFMVVDDAHCGVFE